MGTVVGTRIKTNKKSVYAQAAGLGLLLFFACSMMTLFFAVFGFGTKFGFFLVVGTWLTCFIIWIISSLVALRRYESTEYVLSKDSLAISKGGFFGKSTEMYRYDSIISVRIKEDVFGKSLGYSNIIIAIPKLGKDVILKGVIDPVDQAAIIKKNITELQPTKIV